MSPLHWLFQTKMWIRLSVLNTGVAANPVERYQSPTWSWPPAFVLHWLCLLDLAVGSAGAMRLCARFRFKRCLFHQLHNIKRIELANHKSCGFTNWPIATFTASLTSVEQFSWWGIKGASPCAGIRPAETPVQHLHLGMQAFHKLHAIQRSVKCIGLRLSQDLPEKRSGCADLATLRCMASNSTLQTMQQRLLGPPHCTSGFTTSKFY